MKSRGGISHHPFPRCYSAPYLQTQETDRLGFSYLIADRELGSQSLAIGPEFPVLEDPSLWGTLELFADDETDPN